ncbi:hypothetical protein LTS18_005544 [Coniosporium uncinatum]|uniref:Uncharacterized protein n=1 Tax=Coniosporium uncinatum TaxID=93489 RepID=A0ACC3D4H1_9PEZI|nr:hypothetical protein LTS18_005544 [Coniosporium uncinatum]
MEGQGSTNAPSPDALPMRIQKAASWLAQELGLHSLAVAGWDTYILLISRFFRMVAYGAIALILALYLAELDITDTQIGLFMTLTLLGDVVISLTLTIVADGIGRRLVLFFGALLMVASGIVFALASNYWVLLAAAVFGVISPSGNEIGPFRAIEESTLAHLSPPEARSDIFAWYVVTATIGTATGLGMGGIIVEHFQKTPGWTHLDAYRTLFWVYAGLGIIKAIITLLMSQQCEVDTKKDASAGIEHEPLLNGHTDGGDGGSCDEQRNGTEAARKSLLIGISNESRAVFVRLGLLFALDAFSSGMVPYSLINLFMDRKHHMPKDRLGAVMSATWFASSISNVFASAISKRLGLIPTMVFTHLPSAVFLALIPIPSSLALCICFLVGRATLNSIDQAPRSAFISAAFSAEERTTVMGAFNVLKTLSKSGGPIVTGVLAGGDRFWIAFVVAGVLQASYDFGLLAMFVNHKFRGAEVTERNAGNQDEQTPAEERPLSASSRG